MHELFGSKIFPQVIVMSWLGITPHVQGSPRFSCFCILYLHLLPGRALRLDRFALFFTLCLSAGRCDLHACAAEFIPTWTENARF